MLECMTALHVISQHFEPTNGVQLALIRNIGQEESRSTTVFRFHGEIRNIARPPKARSRNLSE